MIDLATARHRMKRARYLAKRAVDRYRAALEFRAAELHAEVLHRGTRSARFRGDERVGWDRHFWCVSPAGGKPTDVDYAPWTEQEEIGWMAHELYLARSES